MKKIIVNPHNTEFGDLMRKAAKAIRVGDQKLLEEAKAGFAEGNIKLFYNDVTDVIRVLKKDAPPIDFPLSKFTDLPKDKK